MDAMHDTFVEILRRRDHLTAHAPAGLLLRTATNVCLNRLRTERRHPEDADDALVLAIAAESFIENRALANRVLDRLFGDAGETSRLIATLHYVDRLTLDEVAAEVGMSVSGVRKRLANVKARLPEATVVS